MSYSRNIVTSDWIKATGFFGHTPERVSVSLFVEGDDDVPLWEEAVRPYQSKYDIRVITNKMVNPMEGNGKAVLLSMSELGPSKVVAVDADNDLLIDNYSSYTDKVRKGDYVVNTTWYSIENILLQKTKSIPLLESFSRSSKKWFLDYLHKLANGMHDNNVRMDKFGEILNGMNIQKLAATGDFSSLNDMACDGDSSDKDILEQRLIDMGCDEFNLWKAMRGHNLWNTLVKPNEERLLNAQIKVITDQQIAEGKSFDRNAAMNQLGIYTSVKDYLEGAFYSENLDKVSMPKETRAKLDYLFS